MLVYSGGRDAHICPFGRVEMMISYDDGTNWTWPRVILDGPLDDRDSGLLETSQGTLLVTTFSHTMYDSAIDKALRGERTLFIAEGQARGDLLQEGRLGAWEAARNRLPSDLRKALVGEWMIRSTDGGVSWSAPYRCAVSSPHGPTQLEDGRLLFVGKRLRETPAIISAYESNDDGLTWQWLSDLPVRPGDQGALYHEPFAIEAANGRIIAHLRNHNVANEKETLQCESLDGGRTWSEPHSIGIWGLPSHLLKMHDGGLIMTYGHRRPPYGVRASISYDHGESWTQPLELSPDSDTADLGYPSTAELGDGTLLSVWYEALGGSHKTVLRQLRWQIPETADTLKSSRSPG